ncbi:acetylhydrolase [Blastopirellula sp. JC732]|uniref:Acetylhydrolase n=1 Tax=Blastopirellula sediminis TaxID=2894196 RepID=A0A9X1SH35_9BACT|nr:acetylhydrolase [Blastopirellula sediminis]MCC9605911.1 acetylhydrolase [Blastopirellula sediminis]MCC9630790.1 acetylhydrolase [Blastopirellula sediminis]
MTKLHRSLLGTLLLTTLFLTTAPAAEEAKVRQIDLEPKDAARDRVVPIRIYLPETEQPLPVILFSHGLGGSRKNSPYLGNFWAEHGYVCVFLQHAGSDEEVWKSVTRREILPAMKQAANGKNMLDRNKDVSFILDQLEVWSKQADSPLSGKLDLEHVGMTGHSFGAVTTTAVAGRKFPLGMSASEPRLDAFLPMSPQTSEGMSAEKSFGEIKAPMLCMTGTEDSSMISPNTTPASRREVYKALPPGDKYELVFDGGTHATFSDAQGIRIGRRDPAHHPAIQEISLKFWDAYLKNDPAAKKWLQSDQVRKDTTLKDTDVWQWK